MKSYNLYHLLFVHVGALDKLSIETFSLSTSIQHKYSCKLRAHAHQRGDTHAVVSTQLVSTLSFCNITPIALDPWVPEKVYYSVVLVANC